MQIVITSGDDPTDMPSLRRWLMAEPELRGRAVVSIRPATGGPGHMGGALDAVDVVLSNGIDLASLIVSIAAWRASRPRPPQITLERDGSVITLRDSSPETVERILREWNGGPGAAPVRPDGDADQP